MNALGKSMSREIWVADLLWLFAISVRWLSRWKRVIKFIVLWNTLEHMTAFFCNLLNIYAQYCKAVYTNTLQTNKNIYWIYFISRHIWMIVMTHITQLTEASTRVPLQTSWWMVARRIGRPSVPKNQKIMGSQQIIVDLSDVYVVFIQTNRISQTLVKWVTFSYTDRLQFTFKQLSFQGCTGRLLRCISCYMSKWILANMAHMQGCTIQTGKKYVN